METAEICLFVHVCACMCICVYMCVCVYVSNAYRVSIGQVFIEDLQSQTPCAGHLGGTDMIKAQSLIEGNSPCLTMC